MPTSIREQIMEEDPLAAAILGGDLEHLRKELNGPRRLNLSYKVVHTVNTPLMLAIGTKPIHTEMAELLLRHGANVEKGEYFHDVSPLVAACNLGNVELARVLLRYGANVHRASGDGRTPLIQASRVGDIAIVKLLLDWEKEHCIDDHEMDTTVVDTTNTRLTDAYDEQAKNALMHACSEDQLEIAEYLIEKGGAKVNGYKVDTPLWYACAAGNDRLVQLLIDKGASIEYRQDGTIYSTTPLMEACEWGHLEVVKILLECGADVQSRTGRKALLLAKRSGYHEVVGLMELWKKRLIEIERLMIGGGVGSTYNVSPSLLPRILCLTGRRLDLMHRIISQRGDLIASGWNR